MGVERNHFIASSSVMFMFEQDMVFLMSVREVIKPTVKKP